MLWQFTEGMLVRFTPAFAKAQSGVAKLDQELSQMAEDREIATDARAASFRFCRKY